jgi:hypothetical protein
MPNLKKRAALLMLLGLLLQGCGQRLAGLQPGSLPVMPELPASARQGPTPPQCSPTCLATWKLKAEQWQKLLTEQGQPVEPVNAPMTE